MCYLISTFQNLVAFTVALWKRAKPGFLKNVFRGQFRLLGAYWTFLERVMKMNTEFGYTYLLYL